MKKRAFLGAAAMAGALPMLANGATARGKGPALLTITGAISKPNRGALDPGLDQMMHKQKLAFDKACALDFATLAALPAQHIKPTLEYDSKAHALQGPLLLDVL